MSKISSESEMSFPGPDRWRFVLPVIMLTAALLRLPGLFTDLWLDELWTLYIVNGFDSVTQIFTGFNHSNNHHLNSLIFYLTGDRDAGAPYRIHSLLAGLGAVALAWVISRRDGRLAANLSALLVSCSYLMIHFSSEARGYAMVIFFSLAAFLAARRFLDSPNWRPAALFWLACCLGFLSHLMFLHTFIGFLVWLPWAMARKYTDSPIAWAALTGRLAQLILAPSVFLALFLVFVIRGMEVGGAPEYSLFAVLVKTLSYAAGGPSAGTTALAAAAMMTSMFLWAIIQLRHTPNSEWIFFLVVVFLSPITLFILNRPDVLFVRYFLISVAFGYIALGRTLAGALARRWKSVPPGEVEPSGGPKLAMRAAVCCLLLLFLTGNALNITLFYRYGRGGYREAVLYMAERTPVSVVNVTSDHDLRTWLPLMYYKRFLPEGKDLVYRSQEEKPLRKCHWMIRHWIDSVSVDHAGKTWDDLGYLYIHEKTLFYADLSGYHWRLHRRDGLPEP